jgi:anti-sigma factor RsiW
MKDRHIIDILNNTPLATLDQSERAIIEDHSRDCPDCQEALAAAYGSAALLRERATESFTVSPFFARKVLAVLRERQTTKDAWVLGRMWRAAGVLVSSMAVTVAALAVRSFMVPGIESKIEGETVSVYAADAEIFDQFDLSDDQVTDGQVLNTLYEAEEETAR